jgi:hypothetical protein
VIVTSLGFDEPPLVEPDDDVLDVEDVDDVDDALLAEAHAFNAEVEQLTSLRCP